MDVFTYPSLDDFPTAAYIEQYYEAYTVSPVVLPVKLTAHLSSNQRIPTILRGKVRTIISIIDFKNLTFLLYCRRLRATHPQEPSHRYMLRGRHFHSNHQVTCYTHCSALAFYCIILLFHAWHFWLIWQI